MCCGMGPIRETLLLVFLRHPSPLCNGSPRPFGLYRQFCCVVYMTLVFLEHLRHFHHVAFFSLSSTNILGTCFLRTPQAMTFLQLYSKRCLLQ